MRKWAILICALCLLYTGAGASFAQSGGTTGWSKVGSFPAGSAGLLLDPARTAVAYALGSGGISRTTDAGASWSVCAKGARGMSIAGNPGTLFSMGTGGLRQSLDGCESWKEVPSEGILPSSANVRSLVPYSDNSRILVAGMDGLGGVYRSTDSGGTWVAAAKGLPAGAWVTAFTSDAKSSERALVGLRYSGHERAPAYVYRSTDGGLSWRSSSLGLRLLPNNRGEITGMAWSGNTLFAATATDGLYRSTDRGESWQAATMPRSTRAEAQARLSRLSSMQATPMPMGIKSIASGPDGTLVMNTAEGAFSSVDEGNSWQGFGPPTEGAPAVVAIEAYTGRVLASYGGDLWGYQVPARTVVQAQAEPSTTAPVEPTPPPPPVLPSPTATPVTPTSVAVKPPPTATAAPPPRPGGWIPTDPAAPLDPGIADFFPETRHNIKYGFRDYWQRNGGLRVFGYPLTEEFVENGVDQQYFERVRLEYRGDNIVIGLLGSELTKGKFFQTVRFFPSEDDNVYFGPTQHSVGGPFLEYWRDNGGLETLGYPLSESYKDDGSEYQWFERARLEWHPWLPEGQRITLGAVGTEALKQRGWLP